MSRELFSIPHHLQSSCYQSPSYIAAQAAYNAYHSFSNVISFYSKIKEVPTSIHKCLVPESITMVDEPCPANFANIKEVEYDHHIVRECLLIHTDVFINLICPYGYCGG
jgi:hypothetical protein